MNKLIRFFYKLIKKQELSLDENVNVGYLFCLSCSNLFSLIRGYFNKRKIIFIGRDVTLRCKNKISIGQGSRVDDYSLIDGLSENGIHFGNYCSIGRFCIIKASGTLTFLGKGINIGSNVGIGDFAHIGGAGGVVIGDDTIAGAYLSIHPENHVFTDINEAIRKQGVTRKGISIGKNCWIGAKVTILDGSIVGDGCVIAAGAVVNGVFPDHVVIGGVPAKILKEIKNVK